MMWRTLLQKTSSLSQIFLLQGAYLGIFAINFLFIFYLYDDFLFTLGNAHSNIYVGHKVLASLTLQDWRETFELLFWSRDPKGSLLSWFSTAIVLIFRDSHMALQILAATMHSALLVLILKLLFRLTNNWWSAVIMAFTIAYCRPILWVTTHYTTMTIFILSFLMLAISCSRKDEFTFDKKWNWHLVVVGLLAMTSRPVEFLFAVMPIVVFSWRHQRPYRNKNILLILFIFILLSGPLIRHYSQRIQGSMEASIHILSRIESLMSFSACILLLLGGYCFFKFLKLNLLSLLSNKLFSTLEVNNEGRKVTFANRVLFCTAFGSLIYAGILSSRLIIDLHYYSWFFLSFMLLAAYWVCHQKASVTMRFFLLLLFIVSFTESYVYITKNSKYHSRNHIERAAKEVFRISSRAKNLRLTLAYSSPDLLEFSRLLSNFILYEGAMGRCFNCHLPWPRDPTNLQSDPDSLSMILDGFNRLMLIEPSTTSKYQERRFYISEGKMFPALTPTKSCFLAFQEMKFSKYSLNSLLHRHSNLRISIYDLDCHKKLLAL